MRERWGRREGGRERRERERVSEKEREREREIEVIFSFCEQELFSIGLLKIFISFLNI